MSQDDLNYHIAEKHSAPSPMLTSNEIFVTKSFQGFTLYDNIKTPIIFFRIDTTDVEPEDIFNKVDDTNFKEELRSCWQFL